MRLEGHRDANTVEDANNAKGSSVKGLTSFLGGVLSCIGWESFHDGEGL